MSSVTVRAGAVISSGLPSGRESTPPEILESYSPADGSTVLRQIGIEIDLPVNYSIDLVFVLLTPDDELFNAVVGGIGFGLVFSAVTNTCGMGMMLAKLPYNRGPECVLDEVLGRSELDRAGSPTSIPLDRDL